MAWNLLLTSDIGLLSLFTILFASGMVVYLFLFFKRSAEVDAKGAAATPARHSH